MIETLFSRITHFAQLPRQGCSKAFHDVAVNYFGTMGRKCGEPHRCPARQISV